MYISELEISLIDKVSNNLINDNYSTYVSKKDIDDIQQQLHDSISDRFELCSALETLHYYFSLILSEVRQRKREVITSIFEQKPKLAEEKSVLEKKLDAEPEYAKYKLQEELLFQFLEHINNIKNNINWLIKEDEG